MRHPGVGAAPQGEVRERYALSAEGLRYEAAVPGAKRARLQVRALVSDGEARSRIEVGGREPAGALPGAQRQRPTTTAIDSNAWRAEY